MNDLILSDQIKVFLSKDTPENTLKMSSREIAELCGKEHKNVKRDVVKLLKDLEEDTLKFEHIYKDTQNRDQVEFLLDKETCLCLVSGYNAQLRMAIIRRWLELEQNVYSMPTTLIGAGEKWVNELKAHQETKVILNEAKQLLIEVEPKVHYYDIILNNPSLVNIRTIAQDYGMSAQKMNKRLQETGIQYKDKDGIWKVYLKYSAADYAKIHTTILNPETPKERVVHSLKWTQKGRPFIYDLFKSKGILPICEQG